MSAPPPVLIVPVADVARRLRLPQPLDEADRWVLEQAIADAQTDLSGYLGRPLLPQTYVDAVWVLPGFPWKDQLTHGPLISVTSTEPEIDTITGAASGRTLVTYIAGLDATTDPALAPIRRFITEHAMYSPAVRALVHRLMPDDGRKTQSVSVEGQSVSYTDVTPAPEASGDGPGGRPVGSLPTFASCDEWRLRGRRAVQGPSQMRAIWPYDSWFPFASP